MKKFHFTIISHLCLFMFLGIPTDAQDTTDLLPCGERPTLSDAFQVEPTLFCLEQAIIQEEGVAGDYTSLVFDDDYRLYATNPLDGEVVVFTDTDDDDLIDTETILLSDLAFPHGLAYANGFLYILGDGTLYEYMLETDTLSVLVDDLPQNRTFATRAILVHDEFLYIGIPAPCDLCVYDTQEESHLRGTILRMRLDGTERTVIADGLRYPTALTIYNNQLLITDVAADYHRLETHVDEINTINLPADTDTIPNFGFPHCFGLNTVENQIDMDFDCTSATPPTYSLATNSTPFAMSVYQGDGFEWLQNSLLLAFQGSDDSSLVVGHALYAIRPDSATTLTYHAIAPSNTQSGGIMNIPNLQHTGIVPFHTERVNRTGNGIFPQNVYSVAVDQHGWIYFSTSFDGLFVIRP
ncbi:MAG: hypothetical protein AAFV98_20100 [Chloroflexota bacterium]